MEQIREAILAGNPEAVAALPVPESYRGVVVRSDEVGMFEDFQGTKPVYRKVEFWVVDVILVREVGGEVVNDVGALLESPPEIFVPGYVAAKEMNLGAAGDIPFVGR